MVPETDRQRFAEVCAAGAPDVPATTATTATTEETR